jgi:cellulose synthase/poly-beta-1,6-N-acetylglucosamine synthase-like glycosyltransferase
METILETVLLVVLLPMAALTSLFLIQTVAAAGKAGRKRPCRPARPSIAVLVPAHNEATCLADTLTAIQAQLAEGDRLLVVADNCTDGTAAVAAAYGALVCIRTNAQQRGKGYALDHGIRFLGAAPPQVVIVIDADCHVAEGSVDLLARQTWSTGCPAQALYMMLAPAGAGMMARIASFAWVVRNRVRPLGFHRLGLPCQLMGTGMAFPWKLISTAALANGNLVEDMMLGMELAERGAAAKFCPEALVTSYFPASRAGLKSQRYRWEHGHLDVLFRIAPNALLRAVRLRNAALGALALDLMIPPLALFLSALGTVLGLALLSFLLDDEALALVVAAGLIGMMACALWLSWWKFGRQSVSARELCLGVAYLVWKLPVYLRFLVKRQVHWVKSERN